MLFHRSLLIHLNILGNKHADVVSTLNTYQGVKNNLCDVNLLQPTW